MEFDFIAVGASYALIGLSAYAFGSSRGRGSAGGAVTSAADEPRWVTCSGGPPPAPREPDVPVVAPLALCPGVEGDVECGAPSEQDEPGIALQAPSLGVAGAAPVEVEAGEAEEASADARTRLHLRRAPALGLGPVRAEAHHASVRGGAPAPEQLEVTTVYSLQPDDLLQIGSGR